MTETTFEIGELKIHNIPLSLIDPPEVPMRTDMDDEKMAELRNSIKLHGIQQPILIRPTPDHRYEIVHGHRRTLASMLENTGSILARIKEMNDKEVAISRAHENFVREDVTAMDEARYFHTLMETASYTIEDLCSMTGKKEGYIYQRLELLDGNKGVIEALEAGVIEFSHARELNSIQNDNMRNRLLHQAATDHITVRQIADYKSVVESQKHAIEPQAPEPTERKPDAPAPESQLYCDVGDHFQNQSEIVYIRICTKCGGDVALDALRQVAFSGILDTGTEPEAKVDNPENSPVDAAAAE